MLASHSLSENSLILCRFIHLQYNMAKTLFKMDVLAEHSLNQLLFKSEVLYVVLETFGMLCNIPQVSKTT